MRRKLFTLAAALSAVLCLGVCLLWVRSYWRSDTLAGYCSRDQWVEVSSWRGRVVLAHVSRDNLAESRLLRGYRAEVVYPEEPGARHPGVLRLGFAFYHHRSPPHVVGFNTTMLWLPDWLLILLSAPLPLAFVRRTIRRRRRAASGSCLRCGYDLRATPGRCPECGASAPPQRG
jgi:4-amino-4-deoxy-L-arabinose transferase-like glycosyltransferase